MISLLFYKIFWRIGEKNKTNFLKQNNQSKKIEIVKKTFVQKTRQLAIV